MSQFIQVFVTTPKRNEAEQIARALVAERLAACVQVLGPVVSTYWWQGRTERSKEWLCLIKTEGRLLKQVVTAVRQRHSYETPEVIALPITGGSRSYLRWLKGSLRLKEPDTRRRG